MPDAAMAGRMVLGFNEKHAVGELFSGESCFVVDAQDKLHPAPPIMILAEATEEDWRRCLLEAGGDPPRPLSGTFFYFVSMD